MLCNLENRQMIWCSYFENDVLAQAFQLELIIKRMCPELQLPSGTKCPSFHLYAKREYLIDIHITTAFMSADVCLLYFLTGL